MLRGRPDDIREITRLQARIDAIKAGKGKGVDTPLARAAARALNFALGIIGFMFGMVSKALGILLIPLYWAPLLVFLLMAYHAWKGKRFRFPAVGDEAAKLSG